MPQPISWFSLAFSKQFGKR